MLHQPAFIKVFLRADSSSLKIGGLLTVVRASHSFNPTVCLNHTVIHKYLIITEPYLAFSKYIDKLLVVKSLINILKLTYFNIVFYSFFFFFFADICDLIINLKTFSGYVLMLIGMFVDTLVCKNCLLLLWVKKKIQVFSLRLYGSVQDHIKVYGNHIKVSKFV